MGCIRLLLVFVEPAKLVASRGCVGGVGDGLRHVSAHTAANWVRPGKFIVKAADVDGGDGAKQCLAGIETDLTFTCRLAGWTRWLLAGGVAGRSGWLLRRSGCLPLRGCLLSLCGNRPAQNSSCEECNDDAIPA